jgi:signal transduction histidine kinase
MMIGVSDQGISISPSNADKIFDRCYRVESGNTRHISRFGIGLYLSTEIVIRHIGKIQFLVFPEGINYDRKTG